MFDVIVFLKKDHSSQYNTMGDADLQHGIELVDEHVGVGVAAVLARSAQIVGPNEDRHHLHPWLCKHNVT